MYLRLEETQEYFTKLHVHKRHSLLALLRPQQSKATLK